MNHVDIKPNHAPMNSCSIVRPLEKSSTNASKAKDCAWHICLPTHICLHGLLETIMASLRLSVEATMNHVDIKPNHAPMNSCSCVWALEKSSQKHSGRLHGDVKRTKMSGFFMAKHIAPPRGCSCAWPLELECSVQQCSPRMNGNVARTSWHGLCVAIIASVAAAASHANNQQRWTRHSHGLGNV